MTAAERRAHADRIYSHPDLRAALGRLAWAFWTLGWHRWELPGLLVGVVRDAKRKAAAEGVQVQVPRLRPETAEAIVKEAFQ